MTTGDEIRAARQRAGFTQQQLASKLDVSLRTIGNWERGETVSQRHAARIADVLGGHLQSADRSSLEDFSDAAILAEIARRFDLTRSSREARDHLTHERPSPYDAVADPSVGDGATSTTFRVRAYLEQHLLTPERWPDFDLLPRATREDVLDLFARQGAEWIASGLISEPLAMPAVVEQAQALIDAAARDAATPRQDDFGRAAMAGRSQLEADDAEAAQRGEESQDPGSDEPA